ncbi:MAG: hypothetical protein CM15mP64_2920 [Candidatus Neomarinimicrobiota bacterium]|nr:MAG: hypothetical protein CM15mP64_2920 [Candidatus Neomarinimicrobiota bacterium]
MAVIIAWMEPYNFASDVYIGDVSSMVTEFIIYKT